MKKTLSVFLSLVMMFTLMPALVNTVSAEKEGDYTFTVTDSKATITKYTGTGGDITIPDTLGIYPVTAIGQDAFWFNKVVTSVIIPSSVTEIGDFAFGVCAKLSTLTIGSGVTTISSGAFYACDGLLTVTIPSNVITIESFAFYGCDKLTSVDIGSGVAAIGDYAFVNCTGLLQFSVNAANLDFSSENGVLFNYTKTLLIQYPGSKLGDYTIPEGVTQLAISAFEACNGLTAVTFPNSLTEIGNQAFRYCLGLSEINMESGLKTIGDQAFYGCKGITSLTIGSGVTTIGDDAFSGCDGFASLIIPNSVTAIGASAFYSCTGLTGLTIGSGVKTIGENAFFGCTGVADLVIPNSVTAIGAGAFSSCTVLAGLTIGTGVITIGENAFSDTEWFNSQPDGLVYAGKIAYKYKGIMPENTVIALETDTKSITDAAFAGCTGLTGITIPRSVIKIGQIAFKNCIGLTLVTIPNSLTEIGVDAFSGCANITIKAFPGSFAEEYAIVNNIPFEAMHYLTKADGTNCVIDYNKKYIYGLFSGITTLNGYVNVAEGCDISYVPTAGGFGTGTVANVTKNGVTLESYTIIIYGDVTGDGNADSIDAGKIVDFENNKITWNPVTDEVYIKAGDVNGDGNIDSMDAGIAVDFENNLINIDQSTGLVF